MDVMLGFMIIVLSGIIFIILRGSWLMQKRINSLEQYAVLITHFSHEISGGNKEETAKKLDAFMKKHNFSSVRVTTVEED